MRRGKRGVSIEAFVLIEIRRDRARQIFLRPRYRRRYSIVRGREEDREGRKRASTGRSLLGCAAMKV